MTGSQMGGLMAGFLKMFAAIFAVLFAVGGAFASGPLQVVLFVVAALCAVAFLWLRSGIKKAEARYYAHRAEQDAQDRARNPQLYAAVDKLEEVVRSLPGSDKCGVGFGMTSMTPPETYGLNLYVRVEEWDGDTPRSVGGVPYAEWLKQVPESIDGFKVSVLTQKPRVRPQQQ